MSSTISKFKEDEEARTYSELGEWVETNTNKIMEIEVNNSQNIFRKILNEVEGWNEGWEFYRNNSDIISKPMNADEFAINLSKRFNIENV
jgi:hypothetical protein